MEEPNLSYIHSLSGGDKDFEKKIIDVLKMEFPEEKALYFKNFTEGNLTLAAANVHKIRSKISLLGFEKGHAIATLFERNLFEGETTLCDEFENVLNNISNCLSTI